MRRFIAFLLTFLLCLCSVAAQQSVPAAGSEVVPNADAAARPPYRLFNLVAHDSLIEKMNQYGGSGYRFAGRARAEGGATQVLMEVASGGPYEYEFAAGTMYKRKLEQAMNALAAKGFRYVRDTVMMANIPNAFSAPQFEVVMEKTPGAAQCEYRQVMPAQTKNVEKDITTGLAEGFRPVAAVGENIVMLERCGSGDTVPAATAAGMYRTAGWGNLKEREKKIIENTANGYRVVDSGFAWRGVGMQGFYVLLERTTKAPVYKYLTNDYKLPKETEPHKDQAAEFEAQVNDVSRTGYRVVGALSGHIHFTGWATPWNEMSALLEKCDEKYEYRIVVADDTPALGRKLAEAREQGFHLVPGGLAGSDVAILERKMAGGSGQ